MFHAQKDLRAPAVMTELWTVGTSVNDVAKCRSHVAPTSNTLKLNISRSTEISLCG